jgi:hypothetical protein
MNKIEEKNQLGLSYKKYTWNYHKETRCVAIFISNKQKHHVSLSLFSLFSSTKSGNESRTGPACEERGVSKERGYEGEYGTKKCVHIYVNAKTKHAEVFCVSICI